MKRLLVATILVGMVAGVVLAADTDTGQIRVQCNREISIEVTTTTIRTDQVSDALLDLGTVDTNATCVGRFFYIWNTSPINRASIQNYRVYFASDTGNNNELAQSDGQFDTSILHYYKVACVFTNETSVIGSETEFGNDDMPARCAPADSLLWIGETRYSPVTAGYRYSNETKHQRNSDAMFPTLRLGVAVRAPSAVSAEDAVQKTFILSILAY